MRTGSPCSWMSVYLSVCRIVDKYCNVYLDGCQIATIEVSVAGCDKLHLATFARPNATVILGANGGFWTVVLGSSCKVST